MSEKAPKTDKTPGGPEPTLARAALAAFVAWLVPGAGHFFLKRHGRGALFLVLVAFSLTLGCLLDGRLPWVWSGSPLRIMGTLGCIGNGLSFFVLRFVLGVEGDITAPGSDYGSAFILTAGLMNVLLVLDAWDIALDRKE